MRYKHVSDYMNRVKEVKLDKEQVCSNAPIVGVDLAKGSFKASVKGCVRSFTNNDKGIEQMLRWAKEESKSEKLLIAYESTGAVSRPFTMQLIKRDTEWVCLFPPALKGFARSIRKQVKTDKQDARMIEEYARNLRTLGRLRTNPYVTEKILELQEIETTVDMFKQQIVRIKNSYSTKELVANNQRTMEKVLVALERAKEETIERSMEVIRGEERLKQLYELYIREPGVGKELARYLVVYLPELGHYRGSQIAALAGVTPVEKSSGTMNAQRHICGGREKVRKMLYAATVSIYRCKGGETKQFLERLLAAGKSSRVARIATAHKILRILNAKARKLMEGIPIS